MPINLRGAKRRGAGPPKQEMVSLVDKDDGKRDSKSMKGFPALNRILPRKGGASLDELKVSLLDGDSKNNPKPRSSGSIPWDRKRVMRFAALGFASAVVTFLFFNRQRDVHWENFTKMLNPTATGDKQCFVSLYRTNESINNLVTIDSVLHVSQLFLNPLSNSI